MREWLKRAKRSFAHAKGESVSDRLNEMFRMRVHVGSCISVAAF